MKQFLAQPVPHKPGHPFPVQHDGHLHALGHRHEGHRPDFLEYLKPRLFEPLGIENPQWDASPRRQFPRRLRPLSSAPKTSPSSASSTCRKGSGTTSNSSPRPGSSQATTKQVSNEQESHANIGIDWKQGYGFQFWRCTHNAFRGDGAGGQFCVVIPDKDAVVAITADTGNLQGELNAVWDNLYPAFQDSALPENPSAQDQVKAAVAKLEAHPTPKK